MKQTTYQRLKAENEELKRKIYMLVMKPDEMESRAIWMACKMKYTLAEVVWSGVSDHAEGYNTNSSYTRTLKEHLK